MSKNNDYQQRAVEFLRQWQEQMTRQMSNPDTIRAMLDAMQHFGVPPHDANARRPAHAPDARDAAIGDLTERVRTLEQQLAKLHARLAKAEKPAGASKRADAGAVGKGKRTVVQRKSVAKSKRKTKRK